MSKCTGPGCTHPSHKHESRLSAEMMEALVALNEAREQELQLARLQVAFRDLLYRHTRVGRILQRADRLTGREE